MRNVFLYAVEVAHSTDSVGVGLQLVLVYAHAVDARSELLQQGDDSGSLFQRLLDVGPLLLSVAAECTKDFLNLVGILTHCLGQLLVGLQLADERFYIAFLHVSVHRLDA